MHIPGLRFVDSYSRVYFISMLMQYTTHIFPGEMDIAFLHFANLSQLLIGGMSKERGYLTVAKNSPPIYLTQKA